MHLADAFIQSDLQCIIHGYTFFISMLYNTIEHGSSQPPMQKQRGQCGVL